MLNRAAKKNPVAQALRLLRPKRKPSGKVYSRKGRNPAARVAVVALVVVGYGSHARADDRATICAPGYAASQRLPVDEYYPIAREAYRRAGIAWEDRHAYRLDHIIPLCLGGTWDQDNLQVQTIEAAAAKDEREVAACRAVCRGDISLGEGRSQFARAVFWDRALRHLEH